MTRPALPATRDERIALARSTIVQVIYFEDAETVPAVSYGSPVANHESPQVGLYYHVPVGAL